VSSDTSSGSQTAPISLIIFGAIFAAFGWFFNSKGGGSATIGTIFLHVGGAILILGVVWLAM